MATGSIAPDDKGQPTFWSQTTWIQIRVLPLIKRRFGSIYGLSFFICKMGVRAELSERVDMRIK